ncbi:MAG: alpha-amylase family glycosyl hydrolase, partial [Bacteroidota bacterium]
MQRHLYFLLLLLCCGNSTLQAQNYAQSTDIMLQGFNWDSHTNAAGWYNVVKNNATTLGNAGFDMVWLPPPSDAAAPQGYLPRELYELNTTYGTQNQLKQCISALHNNGMQVLADIVINHRVGSTNWADFQNPAWGCWAVVANDEWGQNGGNPCGSWDTGDNYHAARDDQGMNEAEIRRLEERLANASVADDSEVPDDVV